MGDPMSSGPMPEMPDFMLRIAFFALAALLLVGCCDGRLDLFRNCHGHRSDIVAAPSPTPIASPTPCHGKDDDE